MPTILVVEDDVALGEAIAEVLRDEGCTVRTASNGRDALALLAEEPVELVLMDVMMPSMDGLETTQRIRARTEGTDPPIVLMSAALPLAQEHAGVAFLRKPFGLAGLLTMVERHFAD